MNNSPDAGCDRGAPNDVAREDHNSRRRQSVSRLVWRALKLRCPRCGSAKVFRGWFAMHDRCEACGRKFNRSPGYFLGSIYFNYGITAIIVVATYFACYFSEVLSGKQLLVVLTAFIVVFPLWFFRYARALWIALDEELDPWPNDDERLRIEP
jgi:uncharacterized protein (DUF983 family)